MTKEVILYVDEEGGVEFVHDDEVASAFVGYRMATCRASDVRPTMRSQLRREGTKWEIDFRLTLDPSDPDGLRTIGPYDTRAEAIAAEVAWLEWHMTHGAGIMTRYQLGKAIELKNLGWEPVRVDIEPDRIGTPPVMRDLAGKLHKIQGDGQAVPVDEEEAEKIRTLEQK